MLHELDRWLEKKGMRFIRYADDFSIYTKTKATARKSGNDVYKFLRDKLKLPINREKSGIRRPVNFITLGFGFVPTYVKGELRAKRSRIPYFLIIQMSKKASTNW